MAMRQIFQLSAAIRETLPLGDQLAHVLDAARQVIAVDRLHLWALSPGGDRLVYVTGSGLLDEDRRSLREGTELRIAQAGAMGRAVRDKTAVIVDEPGSGLKSSQTATNAALAESFVAVPILARGRTLGLLVADNQYSLAPLVPEALQLLPTFALHIATAVDNTTLLADLSSRDRVLAETIEQQTATSEILRAISGSPTDLQKVLDALAESAARLCDTSDVAIQQADPGGETSTLVAHDGPVPVVLGERYPIRADFITGRAFLERRVIHVDDILAEPAVEFPSSAAYAVRYGYRTQLVVPLLQGEKAIGVFSVRRPEVRPFSGEQIALVKTFSDEAVIAIENTRLFKELQEQLEQQTATSEVLRVISSSPTDLQPVLDAVAESAARLCGASDALIYRVHGDRLEGAAQYGSLGDSVMGESLPIRRDLLTGRAVIDRKPIHVPDLLAESDAEFGHAKALAASRGYRTALAVPLLREGNAIGTISIRRLEVQPFSDKQIALLQTFADQAVIAIENTRLFNELESRNRDLADSLEQQTATSEILRVISSSPTDLQAVLDAVAQSAGKLCDASDAYIVRVEDNAYRVVAQYGSLARVPIEERFPVSRDLVVGRVLIERRTLHIPDVTAEADSAFARAKSMAHRWGFAPSSSHRCFERGLRLARLVSAGWRCIRSRKNRSPCSNFR